MYTKYCIDNPKQIYTENRAQHSQDGRLRGVVDAPWVGLGGYRPNTDCLELFGIVRFHHMLNFEK